MAEKDTNSVEQEEQLQQNNNANKVEHLQRELLKVLLTLLEQFSQFAQNAQSTLQSNKEAEATFFAMFQAMQSLYQHIQMGLSEPNAQNSNSFNIAQSDRLGSEPEPQSQLQDSSINQQQKFPLSPLPSIQDVPEVSLSSMTTQGDNFSVIMDTSGNTQAFSLGALHETVGSNSDYYGYSGGDRSSYSHWNGNSPETKLHFNCDVHDDLDKVKGDSPMHWETKGSKTTLGMTSADELSDKLGELAQQGKQFEAKDDEGKVLYMSKGDGILYDGQGNEAQQNKQSTNAL